MTDYFRLLVVAAAVLVLAGCSVTRQQADAKVKDVQDATARVCSFIPTVQTVLDIFLSKSNVYQSAGAIAGAICTAVTTNPMSEGPGGRQPPKVNGVVVRGWFVR